ncbi:MAG: LL-diaminopimelate aminotransferase, partial [Lachnospiraceae bacterium]|nr:LL-diaminopimelate aminotransferase [Lachnospiraceae bacterium]
DQKLIRMGIGDVTRPIPGVVTDAMQKAAKELSSAETFRGYGPEQGYDFLRKAVQTYYRNFQVELDASEIFISDGAKSDVGNIGDIFSNDNTVLITDPVYPVYVDSNLMSGRKVKFLTASRENAFLPLPEEKDAADLIYICSPNNPTGAAYTRDQLKLWVDFAREHDSVIFYDAAYECFIGEEDKEIPHSIYEVPGAKECAIEFCSFSKKAGFTGVRCGYTVVPIDLVCGGKQMRNLWLRRQTTKFNGTSYISQRGAEAVFSKEGSAALQSNIAYYKENAKIIMKTMDDLGIYYTGGKYSPYIWFACPEVADSWVFFDLLLNDAAVVGTPGAGFGESGRSFFRLTAFSTRENTEEAMERIRKLLGEG